MMAFIGLISLFGIVVNNAIILIDTANKNMLDWCGYIAWIVAVVTTARENCAYQHYKHNS